MGDFDRHETPSAAAGKEKKKLLIVGALGVVFMGILGFHFFKGPQVALAQTDGGGTPEPAAALVAEQTPAQALAALDPARDPTAKLLLGTAAFPARLSEVPRDPFRMSEQWRATLLKPPEPGPVEPVRVEPHHPDAAPQSLKADGFKLSGIFHQDQHLYAIINGSIVSAGMTIGNARVVDIHNDRVVLRPVDSPDGPATILNIQGKLP